MRYLFSSLLALFLLFPAKELYGKAWSAGGNYRPEDRGQKPYSYQSSSSLKERIPSLSGDKGSSKVSTPSTRGDGGGVSSRSYGSDLVNKNIDNRLEEYLKERKKSDVPIRKIPSLTIPTIYRFRIDPNPIFTPYFLELDPQAKGFMDPNYEYFDPYSEGLFYKFGEKTTP